MKQKKIFPALSLLACALFFTLLPNLYADDVQNISYIERGFFRIFTAAFQLPRYLIHKTLTEPPLVGTLDGAVTGAFYTVSYVIGGAFDIARGAVPYAKYLVFL